MKIFGKVVDNLYTQIVWVVGNRYRSSILNPHSVAFQIAGQNFFHLNKRQVYCHCDGEGLALLLLQVSVLCDLQGRRYSE